MPEHACQETDFRISGLQLPDDETTGTLLTDRRLAVCQTTTYRWPLAEDLNRYARNGIGGIGLYRPKLEELDEEDAIELVRSSSMPISSLSWIGGFTGCDGSRQCDALFDAAETTRIAAAVGAGTVAVVSGGVGNHIRKHARRLLNDSLELACDQAADFDVRLSLHPLTGPRSRTRSVLTNLDDTLDMIAAVDRPNLGLLFDLAELGGEADLLQRIPEIVSHVHVVRLTDRRNRAGAGRSPGEGSPSAAAIARAFVEAGYEGPFEFDLWSDVDRPASDYENLLVAIRSRFEAFGLDAARAD